MRDEELLRYSRHILLPEIDIAGQERLLQARVLVVGAGGLGCPLAMYLAASGVGTLVLADHDRVEPSNLQRQIGHATAAVGMEKVQSLAGTLLQLNPAIRVKCLPEKLAGPRLTEWVGQVDVVADCSDNFATRHATNLATWQLRKPLVSGAAIRYEGQVSVFNCASTSPCYACLYGIGEGDDAATCSESGVLSPLVGVVGALMAVEVIKLVAGVGRTLDGRVLLCDLQGMEWRTLGLQKDPGCPVCGSGGSTP